MENGTAVVDFQQTQKRYDVQFLHRSGSRQKREQFYSSAFAAGCDNFRIETLRAHETFDFHKRSNRVNDAKSSKSGTTPTEKIMQNLNSAQVNKMSILFCNVHSLVKHHRPFTDYMSGSVNLIKKKGLVIGDTYRNDKAAEVFNHSIAQVAQNKIISAIQEAKFISIITDGATDKSQEIVYIRFAYEVSEGTQEHFGTDRLNSYIAGIIC